MPRGLKKRSVRGWGGLPHSSSMRNLTLELRRLVRPPAFVMDRGHPPHGAELESTLRTRRSGLPQRRPLCASRSHFTNRPESRPLRPCTGASWKRDMPILLPFRGRQEPLARYGLGSRDRQVKPAAARPPELLAADHSASPTRSCSTKLDVVTSLSEPVSKHECQEDLIALA